MRITENFTLNEMVASATASRLYIDNTPLEAQITNLILLCENVLQPAREKLGKPIHVTSGFRCKHLNDRIGGSQTSDHLEGQAADLICEDNLALFKILKARPTFDQLIWEFGEESPEWIHVSHRLGNNRGQILRARKENNKTVYHETS